jgi:antitoxin component YwqK of YwqJK toxin-antitoxin module
MQFFKFPFIWVLLVMSLHSCSGHLNEDGDGIKVIHFPNSDKISQQIEYKNGKKNGIFLAYYHNGKLKYKKKYKNDQLTDTACFYLENGNISQLQILSDGLKVGCWKKFNQKGEAYSILNFKDDELDGPAITYTYRTLRPLSLLNYKEGKLHGEQKRFYTNGRQKSICYYNNGIACLGTQEWYENGKEIDNKVSINIKEKSVPYPNYELTYYIGFSQLNEEDMVYMCSNNGNEKTIEIVGKLKKENNTFLYKTKIDKSSYLDENTKFALFKKTAMNNIFIQTFYINFSK